MHTELHVATIQFVVKLYLHGTVVITYHAVVELVFDGLLVVAYHAVVELVFDGLLVVAAQLDEVEAVFDLVQRALHVLHLRLKVDRPLPLDELLSDVSQVLLQK